MIKRLVENWKDCLVLQTRVFYNALGAAPARDSTENLAGIQLVGVAARNGLLPYVRETSEGISEVYAHEGEEKKAVEQAVERQPSEPKQLPFGTSPLSC